MNTREFEDECQLQEMAALDCQTEANFAIALILRADSVESGEAELQTCDTGLDRGAIAAWLRKRAQLYRDA